MKSFNLVLISTYLHPKIGGAEKQLLTLSKVLAKKGHNVTVLTERFDRRLPRFERMDGVSVHRLSSFGTGIISSCTFGISLLVSLYRLRKKMDVIHVNLLSSPTIMAIVMGSILSKKVIVKIGGGSHYGEINTSRKKYLGRLKLAFLKRSNAWFVAISRQIHQELISNEFKKDHIAFIPNGVDTELFHPVSGSDKKQMRESQGIPADSAVFMFSGRLDPAKNVHQLIDTWQHLDHNTKNMKLLIIGDGPERGSIVKKVENFRSKETVMLLSFKDDIQRFYQMADVLVSTSVSEGMSNSVLEAMSSELAVIVNEIGGFKDLITHRTDGLVVRTADPKEFSKALYELAVDARLKSSLGIQARKKMQSEFSIEKVARQYEELYGRNP